MQIGVLGTGTVGQTIGEKLAERGHDVMIGTRDVTATLKRTDSDAFGNPPFSMWFEQHSQIKLGSFNQAAQGDILINATAGHASIAALKMIDAARLDGKILIDISNPLDFSKGMPPSLFVCNTDSLGEQIQRAFPQVKVVKTLNTMTAALLVNPALVAGGDHDVFVSGNDTGAKTKVIALLQKEFGWPRVIDLGDLSSARATEMILPLWLRLWGVMGNSLYNFKVVK